MKILAVKGSKEHGEEIIKLFEALGGENTQELSGTNTACIYCMDPETKMIESVLEPDDNKLYAVKVLKLTDEEGIGTIKQKQIAAREHRRERRKKEKEKNANV